MYAALISLMLLASAQAPDVLVVCPVEFQTTLDAWVQYRRAQGHQILVVAPPKNSAEMQATIRSVAETGRLKCLVLIGDVQGTEDERFAGRNVSVPTNYAAAKINTRWGSTPTIASDIPYADTDGDGQPDLILGRIPADSPEELSRVIRKVIRYERESQDGAWQRRLDIVAGIGGFGAFADAMIEAAGRQIFQQAVPTGYELRHTTATSANVQADDFRKTVSSYLNEGSLAWIYLGHGLPTELDRVPTSGGHLPILSVEDVCNLHCRKCPPLAVLVACYTGAFDARTECLAEELALSEEGPVAVIAATRVSMPYGNTVFGYELLRACFQDRPTSLGEAMRLAQCRTLSTAPNADSMRLSLDSLAQGLSPPPVDLISERHEHVLMYHLLGDPLVRLRLVPSETPQVPVAAMPTVGTTISK